MIVVTGGAGFIGSALVWGLNQKGEDDILIVDSLSESENWRNLISLRYRDYLDKEQFIVALEKNNFGNTLDAIIHMGACSSTTEKDARYLVENNYRYTARIGRWQEAHSKCRFIYASSAATYGNGDQGYTDNEEGLVLLKPLNMYGYSKQMFDLYAQRRGWFSRITGLKYFNVFGPNENHKGDMRSVINKVYPGVCNKGTISLFKSYRSDYKDGEQCRDFLYIKDAVAMTLFFLERPDVNGLFNVGTGKAQTWNDVARAIFKAMGKKTNIDYIPMPEDLKNKYQYYTCADMKKMRAAAGYTHQCMALEDAIEDYICTYLEPDALLGGE